MKTYFGCERAPQTPDGTETSWKFGPHGDVRAEIHECPVKFLRDSEDVWSLIRAGHLAEWKLSISEQDESSPRWVDAFTVARRECQDADIERSGGAEKAGA